MFISRRVFELLCLQPYVYLVGCLCVCMWDTHTLSPSLRLVCVLLIYGGRSSGSIICGHFPAVLTGGVCLFVCLFMCFFRWTGCGRPCSRPMASTWTHTLLAWTQTFPGVKAHTEASLLSLSILTVQASHLSLESQSGDEIVSFSLSPPDFPYWE